MKSESFPAISHDARVFVIRYTHFILSGILNLIIKFWKKGVA